MVVLTFERNVQRLLERYLRSEPVKSYFADLQGFSKVHADHSMRVASVALDVALEAGIVRNNVLIGDQPLIDIIGIGSMLHDIGKCDVPEAILNKPGRLDDHERRVMQAHTRYGFLKLLRWDPIRYIAVAHHERKIKPYPRDGDDRRIGPRGTTERRASASEYMEWAVDLVAAADITDALLDPNRKYKEDLPFERAQEIAKKEYAGDSNLLDLVLMRHKTAD